MLLRNSFDESDRNSRTRLYDTHGAGRKKKKKKDESFSSEIDLVKSSYWILSRVL